MRCPEQWPLPLHPTQRPGSTPKGLAAFRLQQPSAEVSIPVTQHLGHLVRGPHEEMLKTCWTSGRQDIPLVVTLNSLVNPNF